MGVLRNSTSSGALNDLEVCDLLSATIGGFNGDTIDDYDVPRLDFFYSVHDRYYAIKRGWRFEADLEYGTYIFPPSNRKCVIDSFDLITDGRTYFWSGKCDLHALTAPKPNQLNHMNHRTPEIPPENHRTTEIPPENHRTTEIPPETNAPVGKARNVYAGA